jgi:hypothetical protein
MTDKTRKKPTVHDLNVYLREGFYLPDDRQEYKFKNKTGYTLTDKMNTDDFKNEMKSDFENHIIPFLEKLNSLRDCLDNFGQIEFWGQNLKKVIQENNLSVV